MFRSILVLISLCVSTLSYSKTFNIDAERTLRIVGPMSGEMFEKANDLEQMTRKSKRPVYIIINSPGGEVIPTMVFLNAMRIAQYRGVTIKCVAPIIAASAAFQVYNACNERYAFKYSFLLFHPVKTGGQFNTEEMEAALEDMDDMQRALVEELYANLGMDKEVFWKAFVAERLWRAATLQAHCRKGYLTLIDDIAGVNDAWLDPRAI